MDQIFIQKPIAQVSDLNRISVVESSNETTFNHADSPEEPIVINSNRKKEEPTIKPNAKKDLHNIVFIQVLIMKLLKL